MKKALIIVVIILIVLLAAYFINNEFFAGEAGEKDEPQSAVKETEPVKDVSEITQLFNSIEKTTQITFSDSKKSELEWLLDYDGNSVLLESEITTSRTRLIDADKIDSYFRANGFEMDMNNLADGTISSRIAFQKDQMVCTIINRGDYEEFTLPTESTMADIEINCGILDSK
jgi:uncharacterized protein YxeA